MMSRFVCHQPTNDADRQPSSPVQAERAPVDYLAARELLLPMRLFVEGHQPLTFVMTQSLYLLIPLADLLGWTPTQGWPQWLEQRMAGIGLGKVQPSASKDDVADGCA